MGHGLARIRLESLVPAAIAATIFAFACGSSSVHAVNVAGKPARWGMLLALLALAAAWAGSRRPLMRLEPAPVVAAGCFLGLAAVSSLWSVDPLLSFARAGSLVLVFALAVLLAAAGAPGRILAGVVAGAVAVALAGLAVLAVDHAAAVVPASTEGAARFRGFGEDANTSALLLGLAAPAALAPAVAARGRGRWAAAGALVLLAGSIVASGSRGALGAAAAGSLVVAIVLPSRRRQRLLGAAAVVAAVALCTALAAIPQPLPASPPPPAAATAAPAAPAPAQPRYVDVDRAYPLDVDVGRPLPGGGEPAIARSFFGSSGRVQAWRGALDQVGERPLLGYGFGTESHVFVDRYYSFRGAVPENAYIGLALQLGAVGLALFVLLLAALAWTGRSALRRGRRTAAAAALGVVAAGIVLAVVQSFPYSAGDIGTAALWLSAFVLPAAAR